MDRALTGHRLNSWCGKRAGGMGQGSRYQLWLSLLLAALCGCALLRVVPRQQASLLLPLPPSRDGYTVDDGSITYHIGDLRVIVEPVTDAELNRLFHEESRLGEYSINPYTFGNWVDPKSGYVPNRFTVFRITVDNQGFAKVELDPLRAVLTTNRPGEALPAYGILAGSSSRTFEAYYRARRRPSGNEYYRYNMRMGIVRSSNYGVDEKIFNGESYAGFVVFDPLDEDVAEVRLALPGFTLKFSAADVPLESVDLVFPFEHRIVAGEEAGLVVPQERPWTTARLRSPSQVQGEAAGDTRRDAGAIDAQIDQHLATVNECFAERYRAGTAAEGRVNVAFTLDARGSVTSVQATQSTVVSDDVGRCIEAELRRWDFGAAGIPVALFAPDGSTATQPYLVTVESFFEFLDVREAP